MVARQDDHVASCPFCAFSDLDDHFVAEHVEFCHPETATRCLDDHGASAVYPHETRSNERTNALVNGQGQSDETRYIDCPHGCGELVTSVELSTHLDLHLAESAALEDAEETERIAESNANLEDSLIAEHGPLKDRPLDMPSVQRGSGRHLNTLNSSGSSKGGVKRLGRTELGPHAHEKRMPVWLKRLLEKGSNTTQMNRITPDGRLTRTEKDENEVSSVIPTLAKLCEQDNSVQRAFFCSSGTNQIFKVPREGGFCGYRNIQMLISYIRESRAPGYEHFPDRVPTILQLQDMIEQAWDMGINSSGRLETGGIRGTRKYIGTPEAQALFFGLGIPCDASGFTETKDMRAHDALYANVAAYFRSACSLDNKAKVVMTKLPPIYLQHRGHSLTIVGFEIRENGSANLLVFDPMFKTTPAIKRLLGATTKSPDPERLLKAYRRGGAYLQKYKEFEILKLTTPRIPDS